MMKYLFLMLVSATLFACNMTDKKTTPEDKQREQTDKAAMSDTAKYTTIEWLDSTRQNLGVIEEGQIVEMTWKFKNVGQYPLVIQEVRAGCGCTLVSRPEQPIAPGEQDEIKAKFDSKNKPGHQDKNVTVLANIKNHNNGNDTQLHFTADVKE